MHHLHWYANQLDMSGRIKTPEEQSRTPAIGDGVLRWVIFPTKPIGALIVMRVFNRTTISDYSR